MLSDVSTTSTAWTIVSVVILFGMIPIILFLLGRAAAAGAEPDLEQMDEARRLAVLLNQAAEEILTQATHAFGGAAGERHALDALIQFADHAEDFRVIILSPLRVRRRARVAFRELIENFEAARAAFAAFRHFSQGRAELDRLERLLEELKILFDVGQKASANRMAPLAVASDQRPDENLKFP